MQKLTPLKAIRAKCIDCSCGQTNEIKECPIIHCPLYPYRFGKNPNRTGIGNHNAHFTHKYTNSTGDFKSKVIYE